MAARTRKQTAADALTAETAQPKPSDRPGPGRGHGQRQANAAHPRHQRRCHQRRELPVANRAQASNEKGDRRDQSAEQREPKDIWPQAVRQEDQQIRRSMTPCLIVHRGMIGESRIRRPEQQGAGRGHWLNLPGREPPCQPRHLFRQGSERQDDHDSHGPSVSIIVFICHCAPLLRIRRHASFAQTGYGHGNRDCHPQAK